VVFLALIWLNRATLGQALAHADFGWFAVALAVHLIALGLAVLGWHRICRALQISQGAATDSRFYILSTVAGRLPGGIWGFASRLYFYRGQQTSFRSATASVVVEQGLIVLASLLTLPVWVAFSRYGQQLPGALLIVVPVIAFVALIVGGVPASLTRRLGGRLDARVAGQLAETARPTLLKAIALYSLLWTVGGLLLFAMVRVFQPVAIEDLPTIEVAWIGSRTISLAATILPSSFGITEASVAVLLTPIVGLPVGAVIGVLVRLLSTLGEFLVAVALVIARTAGRKDAFIDPAKA
jgi:uncharacterized membrane protein YbhN (UPF0104 family)